LCLREPMHRLSAVLIMENARVTVGAKNQSLTSE
jgi:hypothetical protein